MIETEQKIRTIVRRIRFIFIFFTVVHHRWVFFLKYSNSYTLLTGPLLNIRRKSFCRAAVFRFLPHTRVWQFFSLGHLFKSTARGLCSIRRRCESKYCRVLLDVLRVHGAYYNTMVFFAYPTVGKNDMTRLWLLDTYTYSIWWAFERNSDGTMFIMINDRLRATRCRKPFYILF